MTERTPRGAARQHFLDNLYVVTDECKIWPYTTDDGGYGALWVHGGVKRVRVHVLACMAWHGPRPAADAVAAHGPCHNPTCWNGAHVSWKSVAENNRDKLRDGTTTRGSKQPLAKLTEADVLEIRRRYEAGEERISLAAIFGVDRSTVYAIIRRETWRHI